MFWGLALEPGKRYSTTVEKSFHVSMAAMDCTSVKNDTDVLSVVLETEGSESLLCNLCRQKGVLQCNLDLNFMTGDRLTFECRGSGRIHLSGYLLPDEDDDFSNMIEDEEESEDEESESPVLEKPKKDKRKIEATPKGGNLAKKKKLEAGDAEDSDSEEDDSDLSEEGEDEEEDGDEEGEDEEESDEDEEEDEVPTPVKKENQTMPNKKNQTPKTPVTNGVTPKEQKSNKKTPGGGEKTPNTPKQKVALDKGVMIKELKVGSGAPAKAGKMVAVSYIGRLKDGKMFDKSGKGGDFKFRLGKGEVIKGWDIGLQGMRVGGRRTITCPPEVAYGSKGAPPNIPPNSTLNFEVELKNVF